MMSDLMAKELCFTPSISIDEIEENFRDFDFFEVFLESLNDALAYKQGNMSKSVVVHKYVDGCFVELKSVRTSTSKRGTKKASEPPPVSEELKKRANLRQ